jgi:hypothetical protein
MRRLLLLLILPSSGCAALLFATTEVASLVSVKAKEKKELAKPIDEQVLPPDVADRAGQVLFYSSRADGTQPAAVLSLHDEIYARPVLTRSVGNLVRVAELKSKLSLTERLHAAWVHERIQIDDGATCDLPREHDYMGGAESWKTGRDYDIAVLGARDKQTEPATKQFRYCLAKLNEHLAPGPHTLKLTVSVSMTVDGETLELGELASGSVPLMIARPSLDVDDSRLCLSPSKMTSPKFTSSLTSIYKKERGLPGRAPILLKIRDTDWTINREFGRAVNRRIATRVARQLDDGRCLYHTEFFTQKANPAGTKFIGRIRPASSDGEPTWSIPCACIGVFDGIDQT